jgi:hypothetical protein
MDDCADDAAARALLDGVLAATNVLKSLLKNSEPNRFVTELDFTAW